MNYRIPKKFKVFGNEVRVVYLSLIDGVENKYGKMDMDKRIVYIRKKLTKPEQIETFIHEVAHYILWELTCDIRNAYIKNEYQLSHKDVDIGSKMAAQVILSAEY